MTFKKLVKTLEDNSSFKMTSKKKAHYKFKSFEDLISEVVIEKGDSYQTIASTGLKNLTPYSFTIALQEIKVVTTTSDGLKETENYAKPGDFILCGPSKEFFVLNY